MRNSFRSFYQWGRPWRNEKKQIPPLRCEMTNKLVYTNFENATRLYGRVFGFADFESLCNERCMGFMQ